MLMVFQIKEGINGMIGDIKMEWMKLNGWTVKGYSETPTEYPSAIVRISNDPRAATPSAVSCLLTSSYSVSFGQSFEPSAFGYP
jgi:hypothetical protein